MPLLLLAGHLAPNVLHGLFDAFALRQVLLLILLVGYLLALLLLLGGNGLVLVLATPVVCEQFVHLQSNGAMFGHHNDGDKQIEGKAPGGVGDSPLPSLLLP